MCQIGIVLEMGMTSSRHTGSEQVAGKMVKGGDVSKNISKKDQDKDKCQQPGHGTGCQ